MAMGTEEEVEEETVAEVTEEMEAKAAAVTNRTETAEEEEAIIREILTEMGPPLTLIRTEMVRNMIMKQTIRSIFMNMKHHRRPLAIGRMIYRMMALHQTL